MSEVTLYGGPVGKRLHQITAPLYRGTSLIRNNPLMRPYSRTMPRVLWWS